MSELRMLFVLMKFRYYIKSRRLFSDKSNRKRGSQLVSSTLLLLMSIKKNYITRAIKKVF